MISFSTISSCCKRTIPTYPITPLCVVYMYVDKIYSFFEKIYTRSLTSKKYHKRMQKASVLKKHLQGEDRNSFLMEDFRFLNFYVKFK